MQDRWLWRSRWAALGAAVAVSLGGGGLFLANAAPGPNESTIVNVTPTRVLDTRDPVNLGLPGPFTSPASQKLQITGTVPVAGGGTATVVPTGATGVLLNVTAVSPTAAGFVSVRPGDAAGAPTTSSLNVETGANIPNAVQVALPVAGANAGQIDITYDAYGQAGRTTELLVDIVGYTTNTGLQQLTADVATRANGFVVRETLPLSFNATINTDQVVASLNLPAGSYVINAKVTANNNAATTQTFGCSLRLNTTVIDKISDGGSPLSATGTGGERETAALTSAGTLAAPGTANVVCQANTTSGNWIMRSITAVQVAGITGVADAADVGATVSEE